jgi:uncharacterized repeat protein (TIGR01451 family)
MAPTLRKHGSFLTAVLLMLLMMNAGTGQVSDDITQPKGPPYVIDVYYVMTGGMTIDGNLTEQEWTDPNTTVTITTLTNYGWNITIHVFHDSLFLYVGVVVDGDDIRNPNDRCELCFDVTHNMTTPPENTDMKLQAKNTGNGIDEYSLYYGTGNPAPPFWELFSDHTNTPNPWPTGFLAVGDFPVVENMTYEFQIPVIDVWAEYIPPDGNITGFCIHAFGQADNQHVWWPDNSHFGLNPAIEYCNFPNGYGDLIFHSSGNAPDHLEYEVGDDQIGTVDTTLGQKLQMRVVNQTGGNVSGVVVKYTFETVPGGATGYYFNESGLTWFDAVSDVHGIANATIHLGNLPGDYWINASNPSLPGWSGPTYNNTLNATATIGLLASIDISASPGTVQPTGSSNLAIWANDSAGNGMSELSITMSFDANSSGAELGGVTDNMNGTYSCTYIAGQNAPATDIVRATSGIYSDTVSIDVVVGNLANIDISAIPSTVAVTGTSALTIWANDTYDNGIAGLIIAISFDADNSGAGLSGMNEIGNGIYNCTYTAGQTGWVTDTVRAASGGYADTVDIDVEAGPAFSISYVSGNNQSEQVGLDLQEPFVVLVEDQYGNPVPGINVNLIINGTPASAAGQHMTPASNATNGTGAAGSILTLGDLAGVYYVNASAPAVLPGVWVHFSAEALPLPIPTDLNITIFSGNYQVGTAGAVLPLPLVVRVMDGAVPAGAGVSVWFNTTEGGMFDGIAAGVTVQTDSQGQARVNLTLGPLAGQNTVTAEISSTATPQVIFTETGTLPEIEAILAANQTRVVAGNTFAYVVSYNNIGTETAADVWINDTLPTNVVYIGDNSGVTPQVSGSLHSWHITSVHVGSHFFVVSCGVSAAVPEGTVISNTFQVDYTNQAGAAMPAVVSNLMTLTIVSEAVNIPPVIDGVPDLVVHYDWDYRLNLAPYITDPDTDPEDLFILLSDTNHARISTANNLIIFLNYSQDLMGSPQTLNITVSDGLGSDWDVITITVTDDFPPELANDLPDVTMSEDSVITYPPSPNNFTYYFFDRDLDAIIYSTGEIHIDIVFDQGNNSATFIPESNWFGTERITFRATSGTLGALAEDSIMVTVTPVNDPPVVLPIANQTGEIDAAWLLDLSSYITDIDNELSELIVTTDSPSVAVNGLNLTFRFTEAVEMDIVTITVSDGATSVYQQIYVSVVAPQVGSSEFPVPPWLWPLIIIIPLILIGFLVAYARRRPVVEQAFLMYNDGTLLAHAANRMIPDMDSQIFSSMFTAIQDFVKDSFKDEKDWELKKLEFGDNKIHVGRGEHGLLSLALVYSGNDRRLPEISRKTLKKVHEKFGGVLQDWDGNMDNMRGTRDVLMENAFRR